MVQRMKILIITIFLLYLPNSFAEGQYKPCQEIKNSCESKGFIKGGRSRGLGLFSHCINPIMQGKKGLLSSANISLPTVSQQLISDCKLKAPNWGQGPVGSDSAPALSALASKPSLVIRSIIPVERDSLTKQSPIDQNGAQFDIWHTETGQWVLKNWPSIPGSVKAPYFVPDYRKIAKNFETVFFNDTVKPDEENKEIVAHLKWKNSKDPGMENLFNMPVPVQDAFVMPLRGDSVACGLCTLPALVSSTLNGSNMTNQPTNMVRFMKAYFHPDRAENLNTRPYLMTTDPTTGLKVPVAGLWNNHAGRSLTGRGISPSFWYTLGPNVYALQLLSLYSPAQIEAGAPQNEISFDTLGRIMAETVWKMTQVLKGQTATPSFDFEGVEILNGNYRFKTMSCNPGIGHHDNKQVPRENIICPSDLQDDKLCKDDPSTEAREDRKYFCIDVNPGYEPDAAGSVALIGAMAYERWKDPKYLTMADGALRFLDRYDRNPNYELESNFGILAAARLNQHYGQKHDLRKLMKFAFSRGEFRKEDILNNKVSARDWFKAATRPDFTMVHEMWGDYPAYGLLAGLNLAKPNPMQKIGNKTPTFIGGIYEGSAYLMNTFSQAINLAPVAKYYPEYSQLLGKYLLHVANNSRIFFPDLGPVGSSKKMLDAFSKQYSGVPYERVLKIADREIYPSGDSMEWTPPWAKTDLSYYSGCLTGTFSGILHRTSDETILQWDLNRSDFQAPASYPTYLVYNPNMDERVVTLDMDGVRTNYDPSKSKSYRGYDAVDHKWLGLIEEGTVLKLRPFQAMVLKLIPIEEKLIVNGHSLQSEVDAKVVDYNFAETSFEEGSVLKVGESIRNNVIEVGLSKTGQLRVVDIRAGGFRNVAIIGTAVSGADQLKWIDDQLAVVDSSNKILSKLINITKSDETEDEFSLRLGIDGEVRIVQDSSGATLWKANTKF